MKFCEIEPGLYKIDIDVWEAMANKNSIENIKVEIEEVKKRQVGDDVKEIKEKITMLEKELKELAHQNEKATQEKYDVSQWIYNFKRFNTFLANKAIKSIEGYSNYYLQKMKTNEITESIDGMGIENLMHSLNQLNQTIYIITHASGQSSYQNIVNVEKKNGFSYLLNGTE